MLMSLQLDVAVTEPDAGHLLYDRLHPLFTGAGCVLVGPVDGGVDRDGPFHPAHRVIADLDVLQ